MSKKLKKVQAIVREACGSKFWEKGWSNCYNDASHAPTLNTTKRRFNFRRIALQQVTNEKQIKALEKQIFDACAKEGHNVEQVMVSSVAAGDSSSSVQVWTKEDMIKATK